MENLEIDPERWKVEDLINLAISSDELRGNGQKRYMVDNVPDGGRTFRSSGTTGKEPVTIYRSPVDVLISRYVNDAHIEYMLGHPIEEEEGMALFLAAPEMEEFMSFVGMVVDLMRDYKHVPVIFGMKVEEGDGPIWTRLRPDKKAMAEFYRSGNKPKYIFSALIGIQRMLETFEMHGAKDLPRLAYFKLALGVPPLDLGRGAIFTGGGAKRAKVLPFKELLEKRKGKIIGVDKEGNRIPAPWSDVYGNTERLCILPSLMNTEYKVPHPLEEVIVVDPKTFTPIERGEGIVIFYNPLVTSYMEAVIPGDIFEVIPADDLYHGKVLRYRRRLTEEEALYVERGGCGSVFEEVRL